MAKQMAGAGVVLVLALGYVILLQVMAACIVLLGQFTIIQWRTLKTLLSQEPPRSPVPAPAREVHEARGEPQTYRLGGDLKW